MGNFNRDRGSKNGGRHGFGGGFRGHGGYRRDGRDDKQMFRAVCSNCGKDCEVPFRPTGEKPVYCSDCFGRIRDRSERKSFDRPQYQSQFEAVNAKLDKILNLLQPKPSITPDPEVKVVTETPTEETKIKSPKSKKVTKEKAPEENE